MAKKSKKIGKKIGRNGKNSNEIRHLETLIKYSFRAAQTKTSPMLSDLFLHQVTKLQAEIEKLKRNQ